MSLAAALAVAALSSVCAADSVLTSTNIGAWEITLSTASNSYAACSPITVSIVVSNTTTKLADFGAYNVRGKSAPTLPGFGKVQVIRTAGGTNSECVLRYPPPDDRIPVLWGRELNGQLAPGQSLRFDLDLARFWGVNQPGIYHVNIRGKLPSILRPGFEDEFETEPVVFTVIAPDAGTAGK